MKMYFYSVFAMTSFLTGVLAVMSGHYGYALGLISGAWAWLIIATDLD